jgi:hypothetical protein
MSNTFGIKQSFRSQAIARKFARTPSSSPSDNSREEKTEVNVFESGNNTFASSVLNRRNVNGHVQISNITKLTPSQSVLNNNTENQEESDKPVVRKLVNARLLHMKNYNKAVTRSADHM